MNLIVDTLATDKEKVRANLLLAQGDRQATPSDQLLSAWLELSDHPVPKGFQLPIRVVPSNLDQIIGKAPTPRIALVIADPSFVLCRV